MTSDSVAYSEQNTYVMIAKGEINVAMRRNTAILTSLSTSD